MTTIYLAPGHVYIERLGTGIQWSPGTVRLYQGGDVVAEGRHTTASAWEFWHTLSFAEAFEQVEAWWFRSVWTNRVRLSPPQGMQDATTVYGYLQFLDEETPGAMWTLADAGDVWEIDTPYPPNEVQPINVPLRLALARCIVGVLNDDISPDTWYDLTSVVRRSDLAAAFPTSGHCTHRASAAPAFPHCRATGWRRPLARGAAGTAGWLRGLAICARSGAA